MARGKWEAVEPVRSGCSKGENPCCKWTANYYGGTRCCTSCTGSVSQAFLSARWNLTGRRSEGKQEKGTKRLAKYEVFYTGRTFCAGPVAFHRRWESVKLPTYLLLALLHRMQTRTVCLDPPTVPAGCYARRADCSFGCLLS